MASTLSTFDAFMKERYTDWKVQDLTERRNVLLAKLTKDEGFTGDGQPHPLIYNNPQGISGSFTTAQTVAGSSNLKGKKFVLTTGDYYGVLELGDKVIAQSRNNAGAFLENKAAESDGIVSQMADDLEGFLFGNSGNSIGTVASINSNTITLTEPSDAKNFFEDMHIESSENDGSDTAHQLQAGTTFVTSVDYENGTVTVDDVTDITGLDAGDFLFRRGTFRGNTSVFIIAGLGAFIWSSSSSVPDLYSMTRTANPYLLAGARLKTSLLSGKNIEERLRMLGSDMESVTEAPDTWFLHPLDWEALSTSLQSKGIRPLKDDSTRFGYMSLSVVAGGKEAKIFSARRCPKGTAFGLNMNTWKLFSTEKLFHPQNRDGLSMLRKSSTTDYELRWLCYPVLATNAPGYNGRVPLPS